MKIVIWKGYGVIDAYAVDTVDQINALKEEVLATIKNGQGYPKHQVNVLESKCNTIQGVANWISRNCDGDESFERFELTSVRNV